MPDPYCAVYWEDSFVGATQVIDGSTDPIWTGETFVVPLANPIARWIERAALRGNRRPHSNQKYVEPILRLEMYDYNTLFKDVFVGQISLSPQQIVKVLAGGESEPRVYPLRPKMPKGTMRVAVGRTTHMKTGMTHVVIKVDNCKKLMKADTFSESDPYLAAFWDGQPLGESPVIYDASDPKWVDCIFNFPVLDVAKGQGKGGKDGRGALRRST